MNEILFNEKEALKNWRKLTDKGCRRLCARMLKGAARLFRQKWLNEQHRKTLGIGVSE